MRRLAIVFSLISLLLLFTLSSKAQFSIGGNVGLTRTKFNGDVSKGVSRFQPDPGFSASAHMDFRFSEAIGLSVQPGISNLRSRYQVMDDSGTSVIDSLRLTLTSFSMPLHALVWSESGRFYVLAGMQLDYTLGFKSEVLVSPSASTMNYNVRDYNLYLQFGAGFIIPLGKPYLTCELRYSQGILDLTAPPIQQDTYLARTKLTNLSLMVGLQVPLGAYSEKYPVKRKAR